MINFKIAFFKTKATLSLLMIFSLFFIAACIDNQPLITWEKTYGGGSRDRAYSIQQAADKGYFVAAQTSSFSSGGYDYYILKLDERGNKSWEKTFGGESAEIPRCIRRTSDGGCIVAGRTSSFSPGYCDFYIIKLDQNGNKSWEKVYGGDSWDDPWSIQQTTDGGYVVAGFTESIGAGGRDVYILKLDTSGERVWEKTFGGTLDDEAFSIHQNKDNSYTFAGYVGSAGADDMYLARLEENGSIRWERTYGGTGEDRAYAVQQTLDGGFIVAGYTHPDDAVAEYDDNIYVLKLNKTGELN
jgi:hypothetical protein